MMDFPYIEGLLHGFAVGSLVSGLVGLAVLRFIQNSDDRRTREDA